MSEVHGDRPREPRTSNSRVLIARGDELRRLAAALEDARAGHGRVVIVSGEPGIGKTRLCDELSRIAEHHGVPMVWGRCWEAGGAPPFWPWVEIIRSLVDRSIVDPTEIERAGARRAEVAAALADVGRIVPSVARRLSQPPSAPELDPQQARFRLFE